LKDINKDVILNYTDEERIKGGNKMFTNEQIDKLLTMYKENGIELRKGVIKPNYSTVLRGSDLISVRKDLLKEGDRLVISDGETLAIITSVDSIVRGRGLVQFRKEFPSKFYQITSQSLVYRGDVGKQINVSDLYSSLSTLKNNVKRLKYYNRVELKLSDKYVDDNHGKRLRDLNLSVVNNRLLSRKYTSEIEYILDNEYNINFYKILTRNTTVLDLIKGSIHSEQDVHRLLLEKGISLTTKLLTELKEELLNCLTKVNEFEKILADIVIETGKLSRESDVNVINGYISDSERLLQDCIEQDLSGISAGLHSEKLQKLSSGKELDNNYIIIQPLLDELYSADSMKNNRLTFDLEYYLNEAVITYGRENWVKTRKLDYYGYLVGNVNSEEVLTTTEASVLKEVVELIHELFMYVYKKEGQLNVYK
jgi:hypothetical protein